MAIDNEEDWRQILEELENEERVRTNTRKATSKPKSKAKKKVKRGRRKARLKLYLKWIAAFFVVAVLSVGIFLIFRQVKNQVRLRVKEETYTGTLEVVDTEPPQIIGVQDRTVYIEEKVVYKQDIYVEDNSGEEIEVEVDSSRMDITQPGSYPVTYTAADASGNTTSLEATFTVAEKPIEVVIEEDVYKEADKVLAEITDDSMTDEEKAKAIYDWCRNSIAYVNHSDKSSWQIGAYQAFTDRSGDCFNYFAAGKAMLERLGIENIDVVATDEGHYWSMVNLGDGWYHFDVTPRFGDGDDFFMVTDAFLENYSARNDDSHVWDREAYPATPEE